MFKTKLLMFINADAGDAGPDNAGALALTPAHGDAGVCEAHQAGVASLMHMLMMIVMPVPMLMS